MIQPADWSTRGQHKLQNDHFDDKSTLFWKHIILFVSLMVSEVI